MLCVINALNKQVLPATWQASTALKDMYLSVCMGWMCCTNVLHIEFHVWHGHAHGHGAKHSIRHAFGLVETITTKLKYKTEILTAFSLRVYAKWSSEYSGFATRSSSPIGNVGSASSSVEAITPHRTVRTKSWGVYEHGPLWNQQEGQFDLYW